MDACTVGQRQGAGHGMRTAVTQESIEAFHAHRASGLLSAQHRRVMIAVHSWPGRDWSLQELFKATGIQPHVVSARVNELIKLRYLERVEKRRCTVTQKSVRPVRIQQSQLSLL